MPTNRKEHLRYRYGICLSDGCSKCKSKEVQQIAARKDFVCEECQKPLRECPPPKSFWDKYGKMIISAATVVIVLVGLLLLTHRSSCTSNHEGGTGGNGTEVDTLKAGPDTLKAGPDTLKAGPDTLKSGPDTLKAGPDTTTVTPPEDPKPPMPKRPSIQVPFGIYSGPADGIGGEIKVTRPYTLNLRNAAHESIELLPGDVITRTKFKNGELVQGRWQRGSEARSFHR